MTQFAATPEEGAKQAALEFQPINTGFGLGIKPAPTTSWTQPPVVKQPPALQNPVLTIQGQAKALASRGPAQRSQPARKLPSSHQMSRPRLWVTCCYLFIDILTSVVFAFIVIMLLEKISRSFSGTGQGNELVFIHWDDLRRFSVLQLLSLFGGVFLAYLIVFKVVAGSTLGGVFCRRIMIGKTKKIPNI